MSRSATAVKSCRYAFIVCADGLRVARSIRKSENQFGVAAAVSASEGLAGELIAWERVRIAFDDCDRRPRRAPPRDTKRTNQGGPASECCDPAHFLYPPVKLLEAIP